MRRFASVFAPKRDKTNRDSAALPPSNSSVSVTTNNNVRRANTLHVIAPSPSSSAPNLRHESDTAQSSASSSGSASLQTPDDSPMFLEGKTTLKSKSWINSWLGKKASLPKAKHIDDTQLDREWQPPIPPPLLRAPPPGIRTTPVNDDSDSDDVSESDDDEQDLLVGGFPPVKNLPLTPSAVKQARIHVSALIQNALVFHQSTPPFVVPSSSQTLDYPRSSHPAPLPRQESLHSRTLKSRLLIRLQDPSDPLTQSEQTSILPFSMKRVPSLLPPFALSIDEVRPPKSVTVLAHSRGLRRWIERPCFEHRYSVLVPTQDGISRQMVSGTRFAVPDLEFSAALEAMIDFTEPPHVNAQDCSQSPIVKQSPVANVTQSEVPLSPSSTLSSQSSSHSSQSRPVVHHTTPSPLRNEHDTSRVSSAALPSPPPSPPYTVKRGVRFAEDDKEDRIPIGYMMRVKKQREAKLKFLQEEKVRRQFAEEQERIEKERRDMEEQRSQWEKEKKAWEKEKRAVEEERNKRRYAEELAAARVRRETMRNGGSNRTMSTSGSSSSLRETVAMTSRPAESASKYNRPTYDHLHVPTHTQSRRQSSDPIQSSSSSSSRPPSIAGHSASPPYSPVQSGSRPNSLHSSSSDDVRQKRQSVSSSNGYAYGYWGDSNTSLLRPSPSSMPAYPGYFPPTSFDMPLLPPTAPFMLHQTQRPRSQHSLSPSPSRKSVHGSTDRVNRISPNHSIGSNRSASSSPNRPVSTHHRTSSNDGQQLRGPSQRGRAQEPATSSSRAPQAPYHASSMSSRSSVLQQQQQQQHMLHPAVRTLPSRRSTALN